MISKGCVHVNVDMWKSWWIIKKRDKLRKKQNLVTVNQQDIPLEKHIIHK